MMQQMIESPPSRTGYVSLTATASEAPPRAAVASSIPEVLHDVFDGGEIVILAVKPSMWRPLFDSAPWVVTCTLLAGAMVGLGRTIPGLSIATTAQVILLAAVVRIAFAVVRWVPTWYVLTNRRILYIRGVRSPRVQACGLKDVRNTYLHVSITERMTGLGSISFATDDRVSVSQVWQSVHRPEEVHAEIRRAIGNALD